MFYLSVLEIVLTILLSVLFTRWVLLRQQRLETLKSSESMYKVFTDNAYDWEMWVNPEGQIKYMSPSCEKITAYSKRDFETQPDLLTAIVHPDDLPMYRVHMIRHSGRLEDEHLETFDFRIYTRENHIRWIRHRCHPVRTNEGEYLGRYVVNRDITEEKNTQEKIKASTELSYATLESSADHIAVLDQHANIIMVNMAWQNFGYENDSENSKIDWIGQNYLKICALAQPPSDDGARDVHQGLKSVLSGQVDQFEYEYPCHSPTKERWFLLRAVPLQYKGGGILVSHTNITEMKLIQRELTLALSSFDTTDAIVITDANTKIIRVNEAFTNITGYSNQQSVGNTPAMLQSGRHHKTFYKNMWAELVKNSVWEGEIWNRRRSGETYPEYLKIKTVRNDLNEITNYIASFSDISAQKQAEEKIHRLAFYDPLTDLPNKVLLLERLEQALNRSSMVNQVSSIILIDLDNFKLINDSLGHAVGDEILCGVASRLKSEIRQVDSAARVNGDEFAILISEIPGSISKATEVITAITEKILNSIKEPFWIQNKQINISARAGIDIFPIKNDKVANIIKRAYNALHRTKDSPGKEFIFYESSMQDEMHRVMKLQTDLRQAVINHEFVLFYQNQVDGKGNYYGAEALIRWNHPQRGLLSPAEFMDVVESSELIIEIGSWVLQTACEHIRSMQLKGNRSGIKHISVNISGAQFRRDNFIELVESVLSSTNIDASWLELEITESVILEDIDNAIHKMNKLKSYGIRWSIDDFGTGFSSLSYLKDLPFDILKIDRSFIYNSHLNKKNQAIVKAIISMAQNLGLKVIAEGVETREEVEFLNSISCDYYQGFYFDKPSIWAAKNPELKLVKNL